MIIPTWRLMTLILGRCSEAWTADETLFSKVLVNYSLGPFSITAWHICHIPTKLNKMHW